MLHHCFVKSLELENIILETQTHEEDGLLLVVYIGGKPMLRAIIDADGVDVAGKIEHVKKCCLEEKWGLPFVSMLDNFIGRKL